MHTHTHTHTRTHTGFPDDSMVTNLPDNAGDMDSIPGLRGSPGGGNDN